ncbi:hypothetical protein JAAARDRAFT_181526 [Jaapia argillacea MUCL 33604]|uniref:Ubiquinol-cytochrome c chaperone domain-containing protein n=1 Tax=Jaapia argillacea MUCL 33604 TaxID=933084 RepID=A0A067PWZ1_9AGAM|nr:hypothetical protein JAAARDRAFT_181526 [Jaapia argillacea MUCL 33604]
MLPRSSRLVHPPRIPRFTQIHPRSLSTQSPRQKSPKEPAKTSPLATIPRQQSWLTKTVKGSPLAMSVFLQFIRLLGYDSPKQSAARRANVLYQRLCTVRADEERDFWQHECDLPPTFQSWFTVTNLHVWLLTVRFRALPPSHGQYYVQGLIDHFFLDVEDRMRALLQPVSYAASGRTPPSSTFYHIPADQVAEVPDGGDLKTGKRPKGNAPETLITRQMKIFREQWAGMGMALDLGLAKGDTELAGAIWRNLLGARGANGIMLPTPSEGAENPVFRRSINITDSKAKSFKSETELRAAESQDDLSGVHDYFPEEADKYLAYPELMETLVVYIRRELVRLEKIGDDKVMSAHKPGMEYEHLGKLKFGRVRQ